MALDAEAQAVLGFVQPLGVNIEIGSGQQEVRRGLVGIEPQRRLERGDGLGPLTRCELFTADQEVIQSGGGRLLAGELLLALLAGGVAEPGETAGPAQVVSRGRLGMQPRRPVQDAQSSGGFDGVGEQEEQVVAARGDPGLVAGSQNFRKRGDLAPALLAGLPVLCINRQSRPGRIAQPTAAVGEVEVEADKVELRLGLQVEETLKPSPVGQSLLLLYLTVAQLAKLAVHFPGRVLDGV